MVGLVVGTGSATVPATAGPDFRSALRCAARLMGEPVPTPEIMHIAAPPPAAACRGAGRHPLLCVAATATAGRLWIVQGPASMGFSVAVHEACHHVQVVRDGGHYTARSRGPAAERECEAVQARARTC